MKPTVLDVLIILCLREDTAPVLIDKAYFEKHCRFVCPKHGFIIVEDSTRTQVSISLNRMLFSFYYRILLRAYRQDRLLPFEKYGFSALRLSKNAELLVTAFFDTEPTIWNLEKGGLILGGRRFEHQGLAWALDILVAYGILGRECQAEFSFRLQLDIPSGNVFLFASKTGARDKNIRQNCLTALANQAKWKACYGDKGQLVMVERSQWAKLYGHPVKFRRGINSKAHRLLWLCVTTAAVAPVPIWQAYSYVASKKKYIPNNRPTDKKWDPNATKVDDKKKLKFICDARDLVNKRIKQVAQKYRFKTSIRIFAGVNGTFITGN